MKDKLIIRDYPVRLWVFSVIITGLGVFSYFQSNGQWLLLAISAAAGFLIIAFASVMTLRIDKTSGNLTISNHSVLSHDRKEIPIDSVALVQVEQGVTQRDDGSSGLIYQIVIVLKDNKKIPLRPTFSGSYMKKQRNTQRLREFLGLDDENQAPIGLIQRAEMGVVGSYQPKQESITGEKEVEERETRGVRWNMQMANFAAAPVIRWSSGDYRLYGNFLYIAQKMRDQMQPGLGKLGTINRLMYKQSMAVYGFTRGDAPGIDTGDILSPLDERLEPHFTAYTSDKKETVKLLNEQTIALLLSWAQKNPLTPGSSNQLVALYGPYGVYLATLGLSKPDRLNQLAELGVELVLAQKQETQVNEAS
jgi:hypothetical protein